MLISSSQHACVGRKSPLPSHPSSRSHAVGSGAHLQSVGKGRGLACAPNVVRAGEPHVCGLEPPSPIAIAACCDNLVDRWVPVEGFVFLNVSCVALSTPQHRVGCVWTQRLGARVNRTIKGVHMVAETLAHVWVV